MMTQRYTDAEAGFAVGVPGGWRVETGGPLGSRLLLFAPGVTGDFQANVNVTAQDLDSVTPDEFLTVTRIQLKQFAGVPRLEVDAATTDPAGGHLFEWTTRRAPFPLRGRQLIVFGGGRAYVLTATARPEQFDALRPAFEEVFRSFQILDPAAPARQLRET